jgi:hypothetical protein
MNIEFEDALEEEEGDGEGEELIEAVEVILEEVGVEENVPADIEKKGMCVYVYTYVFMYMYVYM